MLWWIVYNFPSGYAPALYYPCAQSVCFFRGRIKLVCAPFDWSMFTLPSAFLHRFGCGFRGWWLCRSLLSAILFVASIPPHARSASSCFPIFLCHARLVSQVIPWTSLGQIELLLIFYEACMGIMLEAWNSPFIKGVLNLVTGLYLPFCGISNLWDSKLGKFGDIDPNG